MDENKIIFEEKNIKFYNDSTEYKIPSNLFPLSSDDYIILNANNTARLNNKRIAKIFNDSEYLLGRCYTNCELLYNALKKTVNKNHLQYLVGWLFVGPGIPVHHALLLYKNKYVLDLTPILSGKYEEEYYLDIQTFSKKNNRLPTTNELHKKYIKWYTIFQNEPNVIKGTFGKMKENCFFIGCLSSKKEGIDIWNNLIKKYPNHSANRNADENGVTSLQKKML